MKQGKVYLVGAGPGDSGLITVKGLDCLKRADVIIYDHLIDDGLLNSANLEAEKIYVGKTAGCHAMKQDDINALLVEKAREGKKVVRLKGGDPFVLGRGGEEAEALSQNRIYFEVVPGVTSAVAAPAYAGIPVTHRGLASSFAVITGHEDPAKGESSIDWEKLATGVDTLVFLMGLGNLSPIVEELIHHGRSPATPVALIREGCRPIQETVTGTLADIVAKAAEREIKPPVVIVVGEVAGLREKLRWFDNRPIFGKSILVTRARHQASALSSLLLEKGAQPVEMPVIQINPVPDTDELDKAILNLGTYHWIVFTSVNGVEAFFNRLHALKLDTRWLKGSKIGTMGPATAAALRENGLYPEYVPEIYTSQGFIDGLRRNRDIKGCKFLLPRADIAPKDLIYELEKMEAKVHEITAYRTVAASGDVSRGKQMLNAGEIDIVTFASSSTVTNLVKMMGEEWKAINKATVACIGPQTAATAEKAGIRVDIMASEHTIPGLVEAIEECFQRDGKGAI
ncbi:uroporphyrinogen-III C-methyltransferase [Chloroflexota bacterium]